MGILNVTPDSFSDGGTFLDPRDATARARAMADEGAHLIDIGGESTRPGSETVSVEEELRRVLPVVEAVAGSDGPRLPVSIDTSKARVAEAAIRAGASMINDVSGLRFDPDMARVAADYDVPVILMHIRGNPKTMQQNIQYEDLLGEILDYLARGMEMALAAGIREDRLLVDPGIGFGKTVGHNLEIIRRLDRLKTLGRPIVIGPSRKAFIGAVLNLPVEERIEGTAAAVALGIASGADVVRVHDVRVMARVARMSDAVIGKSSP